MAIAEVPPGPSRGDGRVPPYNLEAEESLLGAMLLSKDAIVAASELGVTADNFYKPIHGHVFDAITSLYSAGEPADPVTVAEELRRAGLLGDIGGPSLLVSLQVRTPATSSAARYARIVSEHALLRRLIAVAGEIAEMGYRVPDDVAEAVDRAEAMVFDVAQHRVSDSMAPLRDLLDDSLTRLEMLYEKADAITGVPTGYHRLDELLSGLQPSSLVIVGARPATGKCLTGDTLLTDPRTGARRTLAEVYRRGRRGEAAEVVSLGRHDRRLHVRAPSAFVDDGVRPVFRVRTRLGREVRTTAAHPFLTPTGWRPLSEIGVGTPVAVPRALPLFGHQAMPEAELVVLAHLLDDCTSGATSLSLGSASAPVVADLAQHGQALGIDCVPERGTTNTSAGRVTADPRHPDALAELRSRHGLVGVRVHQRRIPEAVFRLPRPQLARFLNRLLGGGGSAWWSPRGGGSACISYCSVSPALVADVAHLLLRFGINARRRRRVIDRQGWRSPGHELEVTSVSEIRHLAEEIGMFSKEAVLANLLRRIDYQHHRRRDHTPALVAAVGGAGPALAVPQAPPRPEPGEPADPVVAWDEIVAIDAAGEERVYDLTVPGDHNFVAGDIFVHNTAFALGLAAHAALEAHRPVLFFSLEMSHLEITQRILASEARVDSSRMRNGRLDESDWTKISHAIGRLAEAPLYIDDNPRATVLEIRAKARRLKSRLGDLGVVVVDYLQLMTGRDRAENRQVEVSEISRGLKVLARELQTPVVALSQLSRGLELRADKRPMLADLRESGCLTADARVLRADTGAEVTMGALAASGERDISVWTVDRDLATVPGTMTSVFPTGVKPVFELRVASGRRVRASANHPFLTVDGWLRLDELRVGTQIAVLAAGGAAQRSALTPGATMSLATSPGRHRLSRLAAALDDDDLGRRARAGVRWELVVAIEALGEAPVFDATVPETHNFVANGIVVHNSLEQDADVVIFLYRDELYNAESPDRGTAEVLVTKHRSGPTGMDRLAFLDHYTRFVNMAKGI
ncbi:MAG: replicative DNA helicase [Acidimicrobiia bacterium]|nr:replicative DNA helicase [Acidimicrobiia bacterium]